MKAPVGVVGIAAGLAIGVIVVACAQQVDQGEWQRRVDKRNVITALWTQIRDWRREAHMGVEPAPQLIFQMRGQAVSAVARTCPDGHQVPTTCSDVCGLADAICDNAEAICSIATELGNDDFAVEKCNSAKASCREAKQRCCNCSGGAP